jgi:hypothetical protein
MAVIMVLLPKQRALDMGSPCDPPQFAADRVHLIVLVGKSMTGLGMKKDSPIQ